MVLSVVIITKNAAQVMPDALESLVGLADEIIVVDGNSRDGTVNIARKAGCKIIEQRGSSFSDWRNQGLAAARGEWLFYLDADERVTPALKDEIVSSIQYPALRPRAQGREVSSIQYSAYAIPRRNIILGREMKHGGWWPDYVKRLFKKEALKRWKGELHEEPIFKGEMGYLENPLIHQKHDNLSAMVSKTNEWSEIEAILLFKSGHPPMSWWRFLRIMFSELWLRLIVKRGFLDGVEGIIYAIYQMWSRFITYAKLWEKQTNN